MDEITGRTDEFLKDESQAKLKCLHGFCPNVTTRHQLGRKSAKLVQEVVDLYEKEYFPKFHVLFSGERYGASQPESTRPLNQGSQL